MEDLGVNTTSGTYLFRKRTLESIQKTGQIEIIGEVVKLSDKMKSIWNDDNLKIWELLKLSPHYKRLLGLNLHHITKMEKKIKSNL